MTYVTNGPSEAWKRIHQAGLAFCKTGRLQTAEESRIAFERQERARALAEAKRIAAIRAKAEAEKAKADRLAREAEEVRLRAIEKALYGEHYSRFDAAADRNAPTIREIITQTAEWHGLTYDDLTSRRRTIAFTPARHEAMWRCAVETSHSLPQIGRHFGGRDHTTILHGIKAHSRKTGDPLPRGMKPR